MNRNGDQHKTHKEIPLKKDPYVPTPDRNIDRPMGDPEPGSDNPHNPKTYYFKS